MDERSIRYSYLLKGGGMNEWSEPGANASFNFHQFILGRYELNLKAAFPAASYHCRRA